ncbi:hypothetical protein [Parafrigoribacterium soli]|uniref:hypothetical protein n=1 Tax=Parafrigoribacterium soli TaxID=3144663 RepID=UPI0032EE51CA
MGYVVASYLVALLVALAVTFTAGPATLAASWAILLLVCVGLAVRSFRGENESKDPPRAWWRMTARPASGFVFALLFLVQGLSLAMFTARPSEFLVAILNLIVAALFLHSSIRLRAAVHAK